MNRRAFDKARDYHRKTFVSSLDWRGLRVERTYGRWPTHYREVTASAPAPGLTEAIVVNYKTNRRFLAERAA